MARRIKAGAKRGGRARKRAAGPRIGPAAEVVRKAVRKKTTPKKKTRPRKTPVTKKKKQARKKAEYLTKKRKAPVQKKGEQTKRKKTELTKRKIRKVRQLKPSPAAKKMKQAKNRTGLTARVMLKNTPRNIIFNANEVVITQYKFVRDRKLKEVVLRGKSYTNFNAHVHTQLIRSTNPNLNVINHGKRGFRIKVECDCEWFLYVCEVALNSYGAAEIKYSNGKWPVITNPRGIPLLCKHLYTHLYETLE